MKVFRTLMTRVIMWKPSTRETALLIVLIVFGCTLLIRHLGWLQFLELYHYDFFVRHRAKVESTGPIVLVEMTESDIQDTDLDYPIRDDVLADLLRILESSEPAVIGLDIWRDIPVPKSGVGMDELNTVFEAHPNIIGIFSISDGIRPPPALAGQVDRIAYNDNLVIDYDVDKTVPKVRRTALYMPHDGEIYDSLPLAVALRYLATKDVWMEGVPDDPEAFRLGKGVFRALDSHAGAYVGANDDYFHMLLDYRCPEDFERYTVLEVLSGKVPPENLKGKIILLGINAPSVIDERVTPIRFNHRGIEIQAMTVNQILRRAETGEQTLRFPEDWSEDLYMLLWCLIGGAVGLWNQSPVRYAFLTFVLLIALPAIGWLAFVTGWWIPIVAPGVAFASANALVISFASYREHVMRDILMKLYSRHVSKEIAESIWEDRESFLDGHRPLAQKLVVTVLFTDLKGFTTISESMEPAKLYAWLDKYLGAMAKVIQEHGGVLKQFTGDGILALFGVPVPHNSVEEQSNDARAAVNCAMAMGRCLVSMDKQWRKDGLPSVSMRAGIYTGEVAAGSVGSDDRFEYAVVGDVVNTAARLESYDKDFADPDRLPNRCRILIGAPTNDLLDGAYHTKEVGLIGVKGKNAKVSVFQVLDETTSETDTATH